MPTVAGSLRLENMIRVLIDNAAQITAYEVCCVELHCGKGGEVKARIRADLPLGRHP